MLVFFLTTNLSYSQPERSLFHSNFEQASFTSLHPDEILFSSDPEIDLSKYKEYSHEISEIVQKLEDKLSGSTEAIVIEKAFYLVHKKKLKWYKNYVSLGDIFTTGKYDCVTGTALYAMIFDQLKIPYMIYEFDYHTFLIASAGEKKILIESTDPYNGVVTDQNEIDHRIAIYGAGGDPASNSIQPVGSKTNTHSKHINDQINLLKLAGLQYFNLAVKAFNNDDRETAATMIEKAYIIYPSERISEARKIFTSQRLVSTR